MTRRDLVALVRTVVAMCVFPAAAAAAEPSPSGMGGDPRSAGEGPGLVGDPVLALGLVVAIAVVAVVATTAWVRLTARRDEEGAGTRR